MARGVFLYRLVRNVPIGIIFVNHTSNRGFKMTGERGRPRNFDADTALDRALEVFWRHGFQGASLSELTEAMGLNKPSLYATFGDKESLYLKALDRYAALCAAEHA